MSSAFLNRFDVIVLENQFEKINQTELKNLIQLLFLQIPITQEFEIDVTDSNNDFDAGWGEDLDPDELEIPQDSESANPNSETFIPDSDLVDLIYRF